VSDIYLRTKVPEDMYKTLQQFAEIRKLDRQTLVRDFDLYPSAENLLTLERKYGDSLSLYDLTGQKPKKARKRQGDTTITTDGKSEGMSLETGTVRTATQEESMTIRSQTAPKGDRTMDHGDDSSEETEPMPKMYRKAPT
jgi:hypothetical protein